MTSSSQALRLPLIGAIAIASMLIAAATARAHSFQTNLYPDIELTDDALVIELWIASFLFPPLEHLDYGDGKPRPSTEEMREELETFFGETCPITIEGAVVPPQLEWLKFEEMDKGEHLGEQLDFTFAKMRFVHPAPKETRRLKIHWGLWFPGGAIEVTEEEVGEVVSHDPNVLDMLIFTPYGEEAIYLTKDEPEVIWHAPQRDFGDAQIVVAAEPPTPRMLSVGLVPVLAIGLLILFSGIGLLVGFSAKTHLLALALATVVSVIGRDALPVEIPHPMGGTNLPALTEEKATDEFLRLHRGIYRAFEAEGEDAIYNNLAQAVDGALLDQLYEEVYHSLIMRSEGSGALSRVSSVDYLDTKTSPSEDGAGYDVACSWRVNGIVRHWGHAHRRTNEYQADYLLAPRGDRWKIASATVNLQKRVRTAETGAPNSDPYSEP